MGGLRASRQWVILLELIAARQPESDGCAIRNDAPDSELEFEWLPLRHPHGELNRRANLNTRLGGPGMNAERICQTCQSDRGPVTVHENEWNNHGHSKPAGPGRAQHAPLGIMRRNS